MKAFSLKRVCVNALMGPSCGLIAFLKVAETVQFSATDGNLTGKAHLFCHNHNVGSIDPTIAKPNWTESECHKARFLGTC
jgi:hypothetical protein